MSTDSRPAGPSPLITGVGAAHVVYGLLFVGVGAWCLVAGADAVTRTLLAGQEVKKLGQSAPGLSREQADKLGAATDTASKGLAGVFVALAGIAAGCFIIQGLPLILIGAGVIRRRPWARTFALFLAVLSGLQGLGLLTAAAPRPPVRIAAAALLLFAAATFVVLLGKRAALEFSGMTFVREAAPLVETAPRQRFSAAHLGLAVVGTAALAVAAVLGFQRLRETKTADAPPPAPAAEKPDPASFHAAVDRGRVSQALECVRAGVHVDDRDERGETALLRAAGKGQARMVVLLLALGAQPNEKDDQGRTPLIRAAAAGHGAVVNLLLGREDALFEIRSFRDSFTARLPTLKLPDLKQGKFDLGDLKPRKDALTPKDRPALPFLFHLPKVEIEARDKEGRTALMLAAKSGHVAILRQLVLAGADKEAVDRDGMTAWMLAGAAGHEEAMKALWPALPQRAYLQRKNRQGKTVYELAAAEGHTGVTDLLRPVLGELVKEIKPAPPKPRDTAVTGTAGKSVLFKAVEAGDTAAVQGLLRGGVSLEGRDDKGQTALMRAAARGDSKMVLLLTTHLGNTNPLLLDAIDTQQRTALMHAAAGGHGGAVDGLLLAVSGAWARGKLNWFRHLDRKDGGGKTAQELAAVARHKDVAEKLEAYYRDNLDSQGGYKKANYTTTALQWAAEEGDLASVEGLLKRKASQEAKSSSSYAPSPLMNAAEKGHVLVVRALLDSFGSDHAVRLAELTRTGGGYKAASRASNAGQQEIAALLEKEETLAKAAVNKQKPVTPTLVSPAGAIVPELLKAIEADDIDAVEAHLKARRRLDGADSDGRNPLMLAAARGNRRLVLLLASHLRTRAAQGDLFAQDKQGRTALIHAARGGHAGAVASMLLALETAWEEGKQNWFLYHDHADKGGKTALDHAKAGKHEAAVKALEAGLRKLLDDCSTGYAGTAVELAGAKGDLAQLERLLARGASVQPGRRKNGYASESALIRAARQGHTAVVRRLLASFDKDDVARLHYVRLGERSGFTAVFYAASEGRGPALRLLLDAFGKENAARAGHIRTITNRRETPLHVAAHKGHLLVVQALLEAFGDDKASCQAYVNSAARCLASSSYNDYTPLHLASSSNHREIVTLLRQYGATK